MGQDADVIIQLLQQLQRKVDDVEKTVNQVKRLVEALQSERPK